MWGPEVVGVRRLRSLVDGLPLSARVHEPEHGGWTRADHFAADQVEWTAAVYRAVLAPYVKTLPKPLTIPRPGRAAKPKVRKVTPVEAMQMLMRG